MAPRFKKGDLVMVDEKGKAIKYEIVATIQGRKLKISEELLYEVKNPSTGERKTVSSEDILRLATPIDSSEDLFKR
ncbi:MAG: hypothetical protein ACYCQJ_07310 [Nitrososphaerales archaeon]